MNMKHRELKIGDLTASIPLVQGGMGVGISLGGLAGAVAKEGAVGIISAAQIGFREPDFDQDALACNLLAMEKEYNKARSIAPHGIIGFNIMVAMQHYKEYVEQAVKLGVDLIISGAGLPTELPDYVDGSDVKILPIVSTAKSASVILRYWYKKYKRTADAVVIEGPEAGGHLGFKREQLEQYTKPVYEQEIQEIIKVIHSYEETCGCHIPVILAGGIHTRGQVEQALMSGADAVQVASAFITTEECDAAVGYKACYLNVKKEDIVIVKSPVGMPGRAIRNSFIKKIDAGEKIPLDKCHQCLRTCDKAKIPYCITDALIHAAKGEVDDGLLFCGANAYEETRMKTVKEIIESLM
ncbi:MAG: nitronate monooxygenase family protein [Lachnospiraceae bacterium]